MATDSCEPSANEDEELSHKLTKSVILCPKDVANGQFLPINRLDLLVTDLNVTEELQQFNLEISQSARGVLSSQVVARAKKVFATLVLIDAPSAIKDFLEVRLEDDCLPVSKGTKVKRQTTLISCRNGTQFLMPKGFSDAKTNLFVEKQWLFQAPVWAPDSGHLIFDQNRPLPFYRLGKSILNGGPNAVYQCMLHGGHQSGFKEEGADVPVAIKKFTKEQEFHYEMKNLAKVQKLCHPHLIRYLATWEYDSCFYIMFPWADRGSLLDVWRSEDSGRRAVWSLEQMLGLADALRILHTLNFRHGDLKPDNILHFTDGVDTLVIADVGVSTIHEAATNARSGATLNQATTKAYEAPDAFIDAYHRKPRSRVYDIWSLGCIYLEFIIWLLYGYDAIDTFNHVRGFPNYSFYQRLGEDKAVVHPDVVKAMKLLFEDPLCKPCTAINDLLKLIEQDLLVVDVKVRVTAEVLYGKLKDIVHRAKEHCLHLRQTTDPSSEIPEMFRPRLHSNPDKEPLILLERQTSPSEWKP